MGSPQKMRTDNGTENDTIAIMQCLFRYCMMSMLTRMGNLQLIKESKAGGLICVGITLPGGSTYSMILLRQENFLLGKKSKWNVYGSASLV